VDRLPCGKEVRYAQRASHECGVTSIGATLPTLRRRFAETLDGGKNEDGEVREQQALARPARGHS
jgi:hypothetical protein